MFLHWIVTHILHILPHISLAGAMVGLPDPGSSGGGEAAIINTGGEGGEGGEGGGDQGTTEGEGGEGGQGTAAEGTQQTGKSATGTESTPDWKTVPAAVKAHITELAKTDKTTANLIQNAVYTAQQFMKAVPGGLKEINALKTSVEEFGGIEEIKNLATKHQQFVDEQEQLDNKAREGNPEVLDNLLEITGKDGFGKLMGPALDKWQQADPEGYSFYMGKIMVAAMTTGGMVSNLNMAYKLLALKTPEATVEAMKSLQEVANWANNIDKVAKTPPVKAAVDPKIAEQQTKLNEGQTKLFNEQFGDAFGKWRNTQIDDNIKAVANGRVLNDYQKQTLGQRIVQEIQNILTSDQAYMKSLGKIYDSRNMVELQKFTQSRTAKLLPAATQKAFKALFSDPGKKPGPKPGQQSAKPGEQGGQQQVAPVKGWIKVEANKAPTPDQIDNAKTPFQMKFKRQAILKDGSKVYWGKDVPAA